MRRSERSRGGVVWYLIIVVALVLAACESSTETTTTSAGETTLTTNAGPADTTVTETTDPVAPADNDGRSRLVVAEDNAPDTFDPIGTSLGAARLAWQCCYETLVDALPDGSIAPLLAASWTVAEDGLSYVFTLRDDVEFHNGEPLTADDVVYSFERNLESGVPYAQSRLGNLVTVEALGDHEVEMQLSAPDAAFLFSIGNPFPAGVAILNREAAAVSSPATAMVGTGPFKMVSYAPGTELVLEAFDGYWQPGVPGVDELVIRYMPEQASQIAALIAGEIDIMFPGADSYLVLQDQAGVAIESVLTAIVPSLDVNLGAPPVDDVRVRRAIALAIDRQAIVDGALFGEGAPSAKIPSSLDWAVPLGDLSDYERNVQLARELLAEAGFPDGLDLTINHLTGFAPYLDRVVEILQQQLAEAGINLTIEANEVTVWVDKLVNADYQIGMNEYAYESDPLGYLVVREGRHGETPPEYASAQEAARTGDPDQLIPAIQDLQRLHAELMFPQIPLAVRGGWVAYNSNVVSNVIVDYTLSRKFLAEVQVSR